MIKLIKPYIQFHEVEKEFKEIFESQWFTKGKYVDLFREELKKFTGAQYAFLATSATTALTVCLKILDIGEGDEVLVSDFSFPASANVVEDVGAKPIFVDVSPETYNMLPEELEKKITSRTKAVIFVDALGNPSGIHKIKEICTKHKIPLIEDAACAIGSSEHGVRCGNIADLTCFSFHPRKLLTTGEGGAITTNNSSFAKQLEVKLNHGSVMIDGKFDFIDFGYNYRLPELQAAMGVKQIGKLTSIVKERNAARDMYIRELSPYGFKPQKTDRGTEYNVQSLVFCVPDHVNRDDLIKKLKPLGVETTLGTYSLSACTFFREKYCSIQPNSEALFHKSITFPCYEGVDVNFVVKQLLKSI